MNDKMLSAKCRSILEQHEEALKYILEEEKRALERQSKVGNTQYETLRKTLINEGTKQGLDRFLQLINEHANKNT